MVSHSARIRAIVSGLAVMFIAYAIRYDFGALLPSMMEELKLIELKLGGLIFTSYFIAYMIFSPIMGSLSDKFTARPIVILSCALMGLGVIMLSTSRNLFEACLWYGVTGLGAAGTWTPVSAAIQRWFERKRRGLALGVMIIGICSGFGVATYVTPYLIENYGWRACWMLLGLGSFIIAGLTLLLFKEKQRDNANETKARWIYFNKNAWLIGISYLLIGFAILVPFTYLPTYSIREVGMPSDASIWLISLIALGGIIGALSLPAISDRMKDRRRMIVVSNSLVAMASMIAVMKSSSLIVASAFIFGLAYGAIWPLYGSCASEYFGEENAGKVMGFWTFFLGLGSILSPAISGAVADIYGTLTATLMLNTTVALISMIPLIFIKVKA